MPGHTSKSIHIAGWLKSLKNDKALLIHAAAQAQKAADYILNIKPDVVEETINPWSKQ